MKQPFLAVILSALVVPGLGQIINHHFKKGIILLVIVFILFIAGTIQLAMLLSNYVLKSPSINPLDTGSVIQELQTQDLTFLWITLIIFGVVWLYAVADAFLGGRKQPG
jgi:hypothetical protein